MPANVSRLKFPEECIIAYNRTSLLQVAFWFEIDRFEIDP